MPGTTPGASHHVHNDDNEIVLHPEDNDLFTRTGKQVIEACRLGISVEVWLDEFKDMLAYASQWSRVHASHVRSCFCTPVGARDTLFFSPMGESFDFGLAEKLTDLNADLINKFNLGMVEVRQIPWSQLDRFLDPEKARVVYGDRPEPHQAVDA